jgi:hypothetical protein
MGLIISTSLGGSTPTPPPTPTAADLTFIVGVTIGAPADGANTWVVPSKAGKRCRLVRAGYVLATNSVTYNQTNGAFTLVDGSTFNNGETLIVQEY